VNKLTGILITALIFLCTPLKADFETGDFSSEKIGRSEQPAGPFKIELSSDIIAKSKFTDSGFKHQHIGYSQSEAEGNAIVYYNPCYREGINLGLAYTATDLNWKHNPFFHQRWFHTATTSIAGFTERLPNWFWKAQVAMNCDLEHFNISDYINWDILLWGRYTYSCDIGIHLGLIVQTGMQIDRVYPVIGFDWRFNPCWKLNAIFPLNMSIVYTFDQNWSAALAARFFDSRHRSGNDEPLEKALFHYQNTGAELDLNYAYNSWLSVNLHGGYTLGGRLKIANRHNDHPDHFWFNPAAYGGGEIDIRF